MDKYLTQQFWKDLFESNGFELKSHFKDNYTFTWYTSKGVYIGFRYNFFSDFNLYKFQEKILEKQLRKELYFTIRYKKHRIDIKYDEIKDLILIIEGIKNREMLLLCLNIKWASTLLEDLFIL